MSDEVDCLTLTASEDGAFQLSGAIKKGGAVDLSEIRAFYQSELAAGESGLVTAGEFSGYSVEFQEDDVLWRKYWLAAGCVLVLATYNGTEDAMAREMPEVERMLNTLRLAGQFVAPGAA